MAKEAVAGKGSSTQATRKTMRKLEKVQSAFRKSERRVGKLRTQLERAEAKLATRVQKLSNLELRLQSADGATDAHAQETPNGVGAGTQTITTEEGSDGPVMAYTPLAGQNGASRQPEARGKKVGRGKR